jgi:TPR repeat protein
MNNLGSIYRQGLGVARDPIRALELCPKAAAGAAANRARGTGRR